jgi:hypothetical protein
LSGPCAIEGQDCAKVEEEPIGSYASRGVQATIGLQISTGAEGEKNMDVLLPPDEPEAWKRRVQAIDATLHRLREKPESQKRDRKAGSRREAATKTPRSAGKPLGGALPG